MTARPQAPTARHPPPSRFSSRAWPAVVAFAVAAGVRLAVLPSLWDLPLVRTPKLDSNEYLTWARQIAAGSFALPAVSPHGPGYPFFLGGLLALLSGSLHAALLAQALLGAAILVRPTALLVVIALTCWLALARRSGPRRAVLLAWFAAPVLAIVVPVMVAIGASTRTVALQGFGGLNFYIGNSPLHSGRAEFRLGRGWDALNAEASRHGALDPAAQDRYYISKTLREIRAHPASFAGLLLRKCVWLVQAEEARDSHS